jgi:hypothetical protein
MTEKERLVRSAVGMLLSDIGIRNPLPIEHSREEVEAHLQQLSLGSILGELNSVSIAQPPPPEYLGGLPGQGIFIPNNSKYLIKTHGPKYQRIAVYLMLRALNAGVYTVGLGARYIDLPNEGKTTGVKYEQLWGVLLPTLYVIRESGSKLKYYNGLRNGTDLELVLQEDTYKIRTNYTEGPRYSSVGYQLILSPDTNLKNTPQLKALLSKPPFGMAPVGRQGELRYIRDHYHSVLLANSPKMFSAFNKAEKDPWLQYFLEKFRSLLGAFKEYRYQNDPVDMRVIRTLEILEVSKNPLMFLTMEVKNYTRMCRGEQLSSLLSEGVTEAELAYICGITTNQLQGVRQWLESPMPKNPTDALTSMRQSEFYKAMARSISAQLKS